MAIALETVVKQLEDSGIVSSGKLENFIPPKAAPKDGEELLRELFKSQHLTKFQAQQVAQGKAKALVLGGYTILDKIGAGGMGQVFKAEHRRMKRLVAIKTLPASTTKDAAAVARFQREVEAAARLRHPNIVAADDADEANGIHFLVMEYVEGSDLSVLVKKQGPLQGSQALNYILQAARGLEFAHGEGIVHRDIKPANLLLDKKGVVKILDMGLARIETGGNAATQAELTGTGAVMGTVDYMAPEQALSTKGVDGRADIYSLGCTLYYLLAGKATYDGDTLMAKLLAHQSAPIPVLSEVQEGVPEDVQVIFAKMVAKKVDDRYQSMTAVIADLETAIVGQSSAGNLAPPASSTDAGLTRFFQELPSPTTLKGQPAATKQVAPPVASASAKVNPKLMLYGSIAGGVLSLIGIPLVLYFSLSGGDKPPRKVQPTGATAGLSGSAPPPAKAPFDAKTARSQQVAWAKYLGVKVETPNSVGMTMILLPPGEFMMGSTDEQVEAALKVADPQAKDRIQKSERPQHRVVITKPFRMSATEITVGQFKKFSATGYQSEAEKKAKDTKVPTYLDPGYAVTADSPAAVITWNDAVAYCQWLSAQEKVTYRLPTEAEWEYAGRAGTTTQYSFGDDVALLDQYGWHRKNASSKSHPVGTKLSNGFGLFDVHGNLQEWCGDYFDEKWYAKSSLNDPKGSAAGSNRVIRGGLWNNDASYCRSASRNNVTPSTLNYTIGFRVARELDVLAKASVTPQTTVPAAASGKLFIHDPAFQAWLKEVVPLQGKAQADAVYQKLTELNPGLTQKPQFGTENGRITEWMLIRDGRLVDISPLRALTDLKLLNLLQSGSFKDLSPLVGLSLTSLDVGLTAVSDLTPLRGMPLHTLRLSRIDGADLSPLQGMPLKILSFSGTPVEGVTNLQGLALTELEFDLGGIKDLSPLKGMSLTMLRCSRSGISDLTPVKGMPLVNLNCYGNPITDLSPLSECKSIELLNLFTCKSLTDDDFSVLQTLPKLNTLNLAITAISDAGLVHLKPLKNLKTLDLTETAITPAGIADLQSALPDCKIAWDDPAKATSPPPAAATR